MLKKLILLATVGLVFSSIVRSAEVAIVHAAPKPVARDAITSDWPCLLGPTHNEVSPETHLLKQFPPAGPTLVWEMSKGEGYASPVVAGDRLVLFHRVKDQEVLDCLNASTGARVWQYESPTEYADDYGYTNGPRSSPAIGGDAVFAIGAEGKLHCLELATGKLRWQHDLSAEYKLRKGFFGVGASPLVEGNLLIVNVGAKDGPCVVAFNVASGKVAWSAGKEWGPSYATPVPAVLHGKRRVLIFAGGKSSPPTGGLLCIDPANGHVDFSFPWRGTRRESVNASSPVVIKDQVFISECYGSGGVLLDVADDFSAKPAWTNPNFGTHFMSAVERDGYLYGVDGHGPEDAFLVGVDLKTGKELWRQQPEWNEAVHTPEGDRQIPTGTYRCWLMPADGHYLCLGEYGHLLWLALSPQGYKQISRAWLFAAGETWTPPVLSKGLLYVCQNARDMIHGTGPRVLCYDLREGQAGGGSAR
jgi:outer membrane protein assembly factor BamB